MLYDHENCEPAKVVKEGKHEVHVQAVFATKVVNNEAEMEAALAEGYVAYPPGGAEKPKKEKKAKEDKKAKE